MTIILITNKHLRNRFKVISVSAVGLTLLLVLYFPFLIFSNDSRKDYDIIKEGLDENSIRNIRQLCSCLGTEDLHTTSPNFEQGEGRQWCSFGSCYLTCSFDHLRSNTKAAPEEGARAPLAHFQHCLPLTELPSVLSQIYSLHSNLLLYCRVDDLTGRMWHQTD